MLCRRIWAVSDGMCIKALLFRSFEVVRIGIWTRELL
jgi:hypothetical protein